MSRSAHRFELLTRLGTDPPWVVYLARDPQDGRDVTFKSMPVSQDRIPPGLSAVRSIDLRASRPPAVASTAVNNARILVELGHPHLLSIEEIGVDGRSLFVVMPAVDGSSLRTWLATPRSTREVLAMFAKTARGLAAAHARSIAHGDFTLDRVVIDRAAGVRVSDVGLTALAISGAARTTTTGASTRQSPRIGRPPHRAPERWDTGTPSLADDVWAFCTVLAAALGSDHERATASVAAALRARGGPASVREAVVAGRSEAVTLRPSIADVLGALDPASHRRSTASTALAAPSRRRSSASTALGVASRRRSTAGVVVVLATLGICAAAILGLAHATRAVRPPPGGSRRVGAHPSLESAAMARDALWSAVDALPADATAPGRDRRPCQTRRQSRAAFAGRDVA
jgi:serine/threonine protein kinase